MNSKKRFDEMYPVCKNNNGEAGWEITASVSGNRCALGGARDSTGYPNLRDKLCRRRCLRLLFKNGK